MSTCGPMHVYAGKINPQVSVPLSAIWFGWHHPPENPLSIVANAVSVQEGDALVVWPGRWQPAEHPFLPGEKVSGKAAKSPVVQTLEEICKIREAGGRSQGFETGDELKRVTELRDAGGEAALERGAASKDPTVLRYVLSVLETFPPKKSDDAFANQLKALRGDASRPIPLRISANRLTRRYAAVRDQADADAAQWARTTFAVSETDSYEELDSLAAEIIGGFTKREDRVGYFLPIMSDETKPRPVRMSSKRALSDPACFDYQHPTSETASDVCAALLSLLKSTDGQVRKAGAGSLLYLCDRITSKKDRGAVANVGISALDAAIEQERDPDVLDFMRQYRGFLAGAMKE